MRVCDLTKVKREKAGIMAFGFFDSIHLGHQQVIEAALRLAREKHSVASVFLFQNNIYPILGIEKYPIYTFEERIALIERLGIDTVYYVNADADYLALAPEAFLADIRSKLELDGFTCGKDFTFGAKGKGRVPDLVSGIGGTFEVIDLAVLDGEKISTERVKTALREGDLGAVRENLGRDFTITRRVVPGRKDGAKLGFPTINTALYTVPIKEGVYFTEVGVDGKCYRAVTNVGAHPTFQDMSSNIESHILDFEGELYGRDVTITFLSYHRGVENFSAVEALRERIAADVKERREYD